MLISQLLLALGASATLVSDQKARGPTIIGLSTRRHVQQGHHIAKRQNDNSKPLTWPKMEDVGHEVLAATRDTSYLTMNISVGTPPQEIKVSVDLNFGKTGGNLILSACIDLNQSCPLSTPEDSSANSFFNSSLSSTFQKAANRTFPLGVTGNTTATIVADTVSVGDVTLEQQPFGMASDMNTMQMAAMLGTGGSVSLGLKNDPKALGGEPLFKYLSKSWPAQEFGFFAVAPEYDPNVENGTMKANNNAGELSLGGVNEALIEGEVAYHATTGDGWNLQLTGIKLGDKDVRLESASGNGTTSSNTSSTAASTASTSAPATTANTTTNTNTTTISRRDEAAENVTSLMTFTFRRSSLISERFANALMEANPLIEQKSMPQFPGETYLSVPCNITDNFTIATDGHTFTLDPKQWTVPGNGSECAAEFRPANETRMKELGVEDGVDLVAGTHILSQVYTAFRLQNDTAEIGFANLSQAALDVTPSPRGNDTFSGNDTSSDNASIPGVTNVTGVTATGAGPMALPTDKPLEPQAASAMPVRACTAVGLGAVAFAVAMVL